VANNGSVTRNDVITDNSWKFGAPDGLVITAGDRGNAWWLGGNPDTATSTSRYYNNEKSAVIGPCVDLSSFSRPMIALDYWSDVEDLRDGAVLQYSTNGGRDWIIAGDFSGAGINWYNRGALAGNPGLQPIGQFGWTGRQGEWKRASFNLDKIPVSNRVEVIFRIAFGSDGNTLLDDPINTTKFEGFAFDNVYIGEKQRNVLVEYFTNAGISTTANDYLNNLYNAQALIQPGRGSDFYKIQYHIANPSNDPINQENPRDPAARSLYYSVSLPPAAVMDGLLGPYFNTNFNGDQTKITAVELDRRALEKPPFKIELTERANPATDSVNLTARVEYIGNDSWTTPITLQVALVEGQVGANINVMRKLLLGTEGVLLSATWENPGDFIERPVNAVVDVPIIDGNNLWLVAFVQDRLNRTVHQMIVQPSSPKSQATVVGLEDDPVVESVKNIQVYPNPASRQFNVFVKGYADPQQYERFEWSLIDQRGVTVMQGPLELDTNFGQQVEIDQLANGMYILLIRQGDKLVAQRKLAIMNQH
jgi:hypothetical protein